MLGDHFREVFSTLRRNVLRTTLTAIGVFWGVFLLVMMVGFGNGLETGTVQSMSGWATNSMFVWGDRTTVAFDGLSPGRQVRLNLEDADALRRVEGVGVVSPRARLSGRRGTTTATRAGKTVEVHVMGDDPAFQNVKPMTVDGRFLNQLDMNRRRKVAVIGSHVREALFPGEDPIGQSLTVRGLEFSIVGVSHSKQKGDESKRDDATVYTPLTTFQQALRPSADIDYLVLLSSPGSSVTEFADEIRRVLRSRHRVAPSDEGAIGNYDAEKDFRKMEDLFAGISALVWVVAAATLAAGLVGVSNIMMVSVRERTQEIGVRKAIGATPRRVMAQIVTEAVVLASAAGYAGLVLGVGLLEIIGALVSDATATESSLFAAPQVTLGTALAAALAVSIGGGIAGLFPALGAARIRTVNALRDE